jgi:hypothetical protein
MIQNPVWAGMAAREEPNTMPGGIAFRHSGRLADAAGRSADAAATSHIRLQSMGNQGGRLEGFAKRTANPAAAVTAIRAADSWLPDKNTPTAHPARQIK